MVAEMHAGFGVLRNDCPMQLLHQFQGFEPTLEVLANLDRGLCRLRRKRWVMDRQKTLPAPIPASQSPIIWRLMAGYLVSAMPFAATKPCLTPLPGRIS